MRYDFSDKEKKILSAIGRGMHGREIVTILNRMKESFSGITGIEGGDYGAQVEGRKLFVSLMDDLLERLKRPERSARSEEDQDNFE